MEKIKVNLTKTQIKKLEPIQEKVDEKFRKGKPGAVFAQVYPDYGYMDVIFIENERVMKLYDELNKRDMINSVYNL